MLKKISSGGDTLIGRVHGGCETQYVPQFLPLIFANDLPNIEPFDDGVDKRTIVASFNKCFVSQPKHDFEVKKDDTLESIKTKFEHTIGRISMLLPIYILGSEFNDLPILYKGIVCYNNDNVIITKSQEDQNLATSLMFQAFNAKQTTLSLNDVFNRTHEVEVFFFKNPDSQLTSFILNFDDFFLEEWAAQAAAAGELTCPNLSDLP